MERREDYGNKADAFFDSLSESVAPLARELRRIIRKAIHQTDRCAARR